MTGISSGVRSWASVKRDRWASAFEQAEWPLRVGSVSSLMHEAAVRLLDTATVSNPPHC